MRKFLRKNLRAHSIKPGRGITPVPLVTHKASLGHGAAQPLDHHASGRSLPAGAENYLINRTWAHLGNGLPSKELALTRCPTLGGTAP